MAASMKTLFLIVLLSLISTGATAQIYKWKDKNGVVHYGDKSKMAQADQQSEVINIKDKYAVPVAEQLTPISYSGKATTRGVVLSDFTLDLPKSESEDVLIGRVVCGAPVDLYWVKGYVRLDKDYVGPKINKVFESHGYLARTGVPVREAGDLDLTARIKKVFINTCVKSKARKSSKDSTYIKIEWTLRDPLLDETVLVFETKGSHHGISEVARSEGRSKSFNTALEMATNNMLANEKFIEAISEAVDESRVAKLDTESIDVKVNYKNEFKSFEDAAKSLKYRTAIIKMSSGHGSGVYIGEDGYVLTNAHVVGDEKECRVISGKDDFKAKVIQKNAIRDVALLKVDSPYVPNPVPISKKGVDIGASLFVIGTPLDMKFSHTITRGIVSAKREMRGMSYIQTDAAINFGNSGGPVFNKNGELVAISVSGLMTREGTSLNINYLIPIEDALDKLNIKASQMDFASRAKQQVSDLQAKIIAGAGLDPAEADSAGSGLLYYIYEWLNQPLID